MSDFDSGNSVICILLDVSLYETKRKKKLVPYTYMTCVSVKVVKLNLSRCRLPKHDRFVMTNVFVNLYTEEIIDFALRS